MGLHSIWRGCLPVRFKPALSLSGGALAQRDAPTFKGSIYDSIVMKATNESCTLYTEDMPNGDVVKIADALDKFPYDQAVLCEGCSELPEDEYMDLQRMFRAYADAGYTLEGWW